MIVAIIVTFTSGRAQEGDSRGSRWLRSTRLLRSIPAVVITTGDPRSFGRFHPDRAVGFELCTMNRVGDHARVQFLRRKEVFGQRFRRNEAKNYGANADERKDQKITPRQWCFLRGACSVGFSLL